ncbi:hypothetical protein AR457_41110 [Streptomyces agglomeratus]|uniref:hypothetical protein n=1 Tax=Streptomyces agglomeratus TaxID=285458 RepID=UPI0008698731|nr:hypothetical protein [Streptomyces agglomeratus]OEJ21825.1 hypothetical protein AR457_41110 [Streptomyces agglomeratus]
MAGETPGTTPKREQKAVLVLPDVGLSESEIETLKEKFHNNVVESMGGPDALKARDVVIVVVVVVMEQ